jgi:prophage tail gpP-like protein
MADEVLLLVGGKRYGGWKSIRVTRSIESIAGSFSLDVSDRWDGERDPWPIAEGDACRVLIDDVTVIDGYIDKRRLSATKDARTLSYDGRDRAGALVDCSAIVDAGSIGKGGKWTFYNVDVAQLATEIAKPFGIKVSVQAGLGSLLTKNAKIVMHPGDTCFEVIAKVAAAAGVLVVSDAAGGIVITRAGTARAASLVDENILAASTEMDATDRYYRYLISSQIPGTDEASGEATRIQAEAIDEGVTRTERVLLIRPDKGYSIPDSRRRADWEARIRAARSEKSSVTVQGWRQPSGALWPINALTRVRAPRLLGVDGDLLISQVEYTIGNEGGRTTTLSLVRPDAFTPEPTATVHASGGAWKELAKGAL